MGAGVSPKPSSGLSPAAEVREEAEDVGVVGDSPPPPPYDSSRTPTRVRRRGPDDDDEEVARLPALVAGPLFPPALSLLCTASQKASTSSNPSESFATLPSSTTPVRLPRTTAVSQRYRAGKSRDEELSLRQPASLDGSSPPAATYLPWRPAASGVMTGRLVCRPNNACTNVGVRKARYSHRHLAKTA